MRLNPCLRLAAVPLALSIAFPVLSYAQLQETVVTATRFPESVDSLPMGVTVLSAADIRSSGASNVNEAIMRLLGVVGRQDLWGGAEYNLDLRGFGETAASNQVIVVDGIKMNEKDLGGTRLSGIPIESVQSIQILRGSGAVLYGEGATGGVIIINTKAGSGQVNEKSASVYAGVGSYGLHEERANVAYQYHDFSIRAGVSSKSGDGYRKNSKFDSDASHFTGQWVGDSVRLGVNYQKDDLKSDLPGGLTYQQYLDNPRQSGNYLDRVMVDNLRQGIFAELDLGSWLMVMEYQTRNKDLESNFYTYHVTATDFSLRGRHELVFDGYKNLTVLGFDEGDWDRNVAGSLGSLGSLSAQKTEAYYLKNDLFNSLTNTRYSFGFRSERIDKKQLPTGGEETGLQSRQNAWELGVAQTLSQDATVYGRWGDSFRLANVDEFSYTKPNTILLPQTSHDFEIGFRGLSSVLDKTTAIDARFYRSLLNNEIGYDAKDSVKANVNFDPTIRQGVEFELAQELTPSLKAKVISGIRQSKFREGSYAGKVVPLAPKYTTAVRLDWNMGDGHKLIGGLNVVASQKPGSDFDNACRIPTYTTTDARYDFDRNGVNLSFGISNLFDKKYYTQAFGCEQGVVNGIYPELGRTFLASAKFSF